MHPSRSPNFATAGVARQPRACSRSLSDLRLSEVRSAPAVDSGRLVLVATACRIGGNGPESVANGRFPRAGSRSPKSEIANLEIATPPGAPNRKSPRLLPPASSGCVLAIIERSSPVRSAKRSCSRLGKVGAGCDRMSNRGERAGIGRQRTIPSRRP